MIPPSAAQPAFKRIIPSPLKVIFAKKSAPGCILIATIPAIPKTHPITLETDILSSENIMVERIIRKKPPIESNIVDLALGLYPNPIYANM